MTHPDISAQGAPPRRSAAARFRRLARRAGAVLLALFILLAVALTAAWYWSDRDDSLAVTLNFIQRFLPAGTTLEADGVTGSVRHGGTIAQLRLTQAGSSADGYTGGDLRIILDGLKLDWQPGLLPRRTLHFGTLHIDRARIHEGRSAAAPLEIHPRPAAPAPAPEEEP